MVDEVVDRAAQADGAVVVHQRRSTRVGLLLALAALLCGCSAAGLASSSQAAPSASAAGVAQTSPGASWSPGVFPGLSPGASVTIGPISVWNATDMPITLTLEGVPIARLDPGTAQDPVSLTSEPPLPWTFEVRNDAGFLMVSFEVATPGPFGSRNDLSCGRIDIWSITPILGPMNGPGTPGDCGPT